MNIVNPIKTDVYRQYGYCNWCSIAKGLFFNRTLRVIIAIRLCQTIASSNKIIRLTLPFFRLIHRISTHWAALDFPWQTSIGTGISITHGWGLVVNAGSIIGNNVTLFHGVTLGRRDQISNEGLRLTGYPVLEDEVWVGPHAVIVGGIVIGRGSRVAGGAFITRDIPPYSIVVGNPAKIVKRNCVPDVMNPVNI